MGRNSGNSTWVVILWIGFTSVVFLDTSNLLLNLAQLELPSRKLMVQVIIGFWMSALTLDKIKVGAKTGGFPRCLGCSLERWAIRPSNPLLV